MPATASPVHTAQSFPFFPTFVPGTERGYRSLPPHVVSPISLFRENLKDACTLLQAQAHLLSQDIVMAVNTSSTQLPQAVPMQAHRFHLLDALRGLAAMLVVLYHSPLELQARFHFPNTYLAVDFFFCLSGFVIAYSYGDRLRQGMRFTDFAVMRLLRLYPLFALSIGLAALRTFVSPLKLHDVHSAAELGALICTSFLLIPNFFVGGLGADLFPLNVPAWSLFLELFANAVFAVCLRSARPSRFFAVLYGLSSLALSVCVYTSGTLDAGAEWQGFVFGIARVGVSFIAGVFVFHLFRRRGMRPMSPRHSIAVAIVAVAGLVGSLTFSDGFTGSALFPLFAATLFFPALVYLCAHCALPAPLHTACATLGSVSYPLYILHVPLMLPYRSLIALPFFTTHPDSLPYLAFVDLAVLLPICLWCSRLELPLRQRLTMAYRNAWQPRLHEAPLTPRL